MKPAPIDYDTVREMLRTATPDRVLRFIGKSHPADIALLFKGLDSAEVRELINYPDGTVGRLMTTDFMALPPDATAQGAIDKIRERGELESFFYLYVIDEDGKLAGVVPIRNLSLIHI